MDSIYSSALGIDLGGIVASPTFDHKPGRVFAAPAVVGGCDSNTFSDTPRSSGGTWVCFKNGQDVRLKALGLRFRCTLSHCSIFFLGRNSFEGS